MTKGSKQSRRARDIKEKVELRARWPEKFRSHCADIAANRGLKAFERDSMAWATDGTTEWVFYRPVIAHIAENLWFDAWRILYVNPAALDRTNCDAALGIPENPDPS
jgi:hypothetical protein